MVNFGMMNHWQIIGVFVIIYVKVDNFVIVVIIMVNSELEALKKEIEVLREEINTYIEYPEIFKEELVDSSNKIDVLINKYISLSSK